jgi:DNA-binding transcriptional ArsR family regulator
MSGSQIYTLTRICSVEYTKGVETVFEIIAKPTVSKHLRVLREAGFVESTVDAQRRLYRLKPEPLQSVDALERHLDRMDQSTPTKE